MKLVPLGSRVLIRRKPELTKTAGGIFIPDTATEKPVEGDVIAVGEGRLLDNGTLIAPKVKEGDHVLFAKFAGVEVVSNDDGYYLIMHESEILGRLVDG